MAYRGKVTTRVSVSLSILCFSPKCLYKGLTILPRREDLNALIMKNWGTMPCSPLKVTRRFEETFLYFHGRKVSQECSVIIPALRWFIAWFFTLFRRWGRHIPPKTLLSLRWLHCNTCQKMKYWRGKYDSSAAERRWLQKRMDNVPYFDLHSCNTVGEI
jgi:hypothetical protein